MRIKMQARQALDSALLKNSVTDAEIMMSETKTISIELQDNSIHVATEDYSEWTGIRAFKGHSLGFSAVNSLNENRISGAIDEAVRIAGVAPPDKSNVLPEPVVIPWVKGMYDKDLAGMTLDESITIAKSIVDTCKNYDKRVSIDAGSFQIMVSNIAITSSKGIEVSTRQSFAFYDIMGMARDGDVVSSFDIEYGGTRKKHEIDVVSSAKRLSKKVIASLGAKSGKSFKGQVILHGDAASDLLISMLLWSTYAENIQMGSSRFAGKLGKKIASSKLTIKDWGRAPGMVGSYPFDREGIPPKRLFPIHNGIFQEPYHNAKSASRDGLVSNGHAGGSASTTPRIESSNVIVKPGEATLEEIIQDTKLGILVGRFSGNVDPSSGDFSGSVKGGYLIENGKKTQPLLGTMIAGNIFDSIKNISAISSDTISLVTKIVPSVRFEGITVSSQ